MNLPIEDLYENYTDAYAAISNDRDFESQARRLYLEINDLKKDHDRKCSTLELFAGPAVHSYFLTTNHQCDAYCIDSASQMKGAAISASGLSPANYAVALLPSKVQNIFPGILFDLIFIPRYSIGYISPDLLIEVLCDLKAVLAADGAVIFELHEKTQVESRFANLPIKHRDAPGVHGDTRNYRCTWPSKLEFSGSDASMCEMTVDLEIIDEGIVIESVQFSSREYLYSTEEIVRLGAKAGLKREASGAYAEFPNAEVLKLSAEVF